MFIFFQLCRLAYDILTPAYWPADPRDRVLAFRDLRDAGRFSSELVPKATAILRVKGAIPSSLRLLSEWRIVPRIHDLAGSLQEVDLGSRC
jgi:hypothetical protein